MNGQICRGGAWVRGLIIAAIAVASVIAPAGPAAAESPTPWAHGVPTADQAQANALFEEGNQLFAQKAHALALDKYKAAIALWDHPMIRFNMAVTEIRLERILEATHDLERALRFGEAPFAPGLYHQALDYQTLLKGRIGDLEVSCEQAGVQVMLDGQPLFECPGVRTLRVMAGEHVVVGDRAGFLTSSTRVVVASGDTAAHRIQLVSLEAATVIEYPHPRWLPWTIVGGGAAITLGGLGFYLAGKDQLASFHNDFASQCASGCEADLSDHAVLKGARDGAALKGQIAASMAIVGGAVTAAGVVFAVINRPVKKLPRIEAAPLPGGASATVRWEF